MSESHAKNKNVFKSLATPILGVLLLIVRTLIWIGDTLMILPEMLFGHIRSILSSILKLIAKFTRLLTGGISTLLQDVSSTAMSIVSMPIRVGRVALKKVSAADMGRKKKVDSSANARVVSDRSKTTHRTVFGNLKFFVFGIFVAFMIAVVFEGYHFVYNLPNPRSIGNINYPVSTQIFDRKGKLLYEIYETHNRIPIELKDVPDTVIKATISIEDKDFYRHNGISPIGGVARAVKDMLLKKSLQGGSTITQQLVKTALLSPERTITRKVREMFLALWTERVFNKDEILEMYLNQVPYGGAAYGIEAASQNYFGKNVSELTISESAFLAGLPQAPTRYSPYTNPALAEYRRHDVLKSMLDVGYITDEEYDMAISETLNIRQPLQPIRAPHFVFYVRNLLVEKYGIRAVEEGGLRVVTTLDLDLQERQESLLNEELAKVAHLNIGNGAVVSTVPPTGEILTMVGSKNYFEEPFGAFNVTLALRQPGSSIKPLMYSLALEETYTAATIIDDAPVIFTSQGAPSYQPVNYDGRYHGKVPLRYALANSYNVPAVKVLNSIGVDAFITHAEKLGITSWNERDRYGLALTLGGGEVTMVDMAVAFGSFANGGIKVPVNPILEVIDYRGNVFYKNERAEKRGERVMSEGVAFIISDILSDSLARRAAFGSQSKLEISGETVAVKTGTTNDFRDNWTVGYTPALLTAVWVGNNDNVPMNQHLVSGVTGAAPIWNAAMTDMLQSDYAENLDLRTVPSVFVKPDDLVSRPCYFGKEEHFVPGTEDRAPCNPSFLQPTSILTPAHINQ